MSYNRLQGNCDDKLNYIQCFSSDNKISVLNDQTEEISSTSGVLNLFFIFYPIMEGNHQIYPKKS